MINKLIKNIGTATHNNVLFYDFDYAYNNFIIINNPTENHNKKYYRRYVSGILFGFYIKKYEYIY